MKEESSVKNDQKNPFITETADLAGGDAQHRKSLRNRSNLPLSFSSPLPLSFLIITIFFSPLLPLLEIFFHHNDHSVSDWLCVLNYSVHVHINSSSGLVNRSTLWHHWPISKCMILFCKVLWFEIIRSECEVFVLYHAVKHTALWIVCKMQGL